MNSNSRTKQLNITCAARNCYNTSFNRPSMKFFPFPKDYTYARVWANNCKRDDIASKPISVMMRHSLCAEHFQDKYFNIYYEPKTVFRKDLQPIPTIFDTQDINAVDPLEVKFCEDSKEDILLDTYTNTYVNVPLELPDDIGPNSEFGKLNYTEDLYEDFVSNPNVLNVQTNVADRLILRDYCRLCARQLPIASLIPIFDNKFLNYGDMLEYVIPGLFKKDDKYPHQICSSCIGKLELSYNTLKSFRESDKILKNIFNEKTDNFTEENIKSVRGVSNLLNTLERKSLITVSADSKAENCTEEEVTKVLTTRAENIEHNTNNKNEEEVQIKYQCSICSKVFNNEREIRDHSKFRHCDMTNKNYRIVKVKLCKKKDKPITKTINTETQKKLDTNDANEPQSKEDTNTVTTTEKFHYVYKHQCSKCYKVYRIEQHLICHTKDQHPELEKPESKLIKVKKKGVIRISPKQPSTTRLECLHCHTQHRTKESLLKHTRLYHPAVKIEEVVCRILKSKKYRNHSITCLRCSETFETIKKYRLHMTKHAIYKCEVCGIIFDKFYKLRSHKKVHNVILQTCIECNKEFPSKRELKKHEEIHIVNENVECDICKVMCTSKFKLKQHKRYHVSSLCNVCGKLFASEQQLKYHIQTHSDTRPYKCSNCDKSFKTSQTLAKHKECHALDKKYVCQFCGKQFRTQGTIKQHLQLHKDVKKHSCRVCGVKFTRKGNLVKHMERHNLIDDVYKCKLCEKQYNNYHSLIFHKCTKTVAKQYFCLTCEKAFPSNYHLKIHQRLHSGERPFSCEKCSKSFRSKQSLKQHRVIHFDNFPHECQYCDKKFRRRQTLAIHKRRCHSEEKNKKNVLKQEGMISDDITNDDHSVDVESNILHSVLKHSP